MIVGELRVLFKSVIKKCGPIKITQVILASVLGGCTSGLIALNVLPNEPETKSIEEKEKSNHEN